MHCSRMRTTRSLTISCSITGGLLNPPNADPTPPDADPPMQIPWMQTPLDADPLDADSPSGHVPSNACWAASTQPLPRGQKE